SGVSVVFVVVVLLLLSSLASQPVMRSGPPARTKAVHKSKDQRDAVRDVMVIPFVLGYPRSVSTGRDGGALLVGGCSCALLSRRVFDGLGRRFGVAGLVGDRKST